MVGNKLQKSLDEVADRFAQARDSRRWYCGELRRAETDSAHRVALVGNDVELRGASAVALYGELFAQ